MQRNSQNDEDTVPQEAAQAIITASNLLNDEQQCHKAAAAHFTSAFRLAPLLASAFAEEFAEAADALATHRSQNKGSEEAWPRSATAYLTCINACPANALLLTRLGVAAHARRQARGKQGGVRQGRDGRRRVAAEAARRCGAALIENWHWRMLADTARNEFFAGAVARAVAAARRPSLDVGSGTGLLARRCSCGRRGARSPSSSGARRWRASASEVLRLNRIDVTLHCAESTR